MKARELEREIERAGWELARISGGHRVYRHPIYGMQVLGYRPQMNVDGIRLAHVRRGFKLKEGFAG